MTYSNPVENGIQLKRLMAQERYSAEDMTKRLGNKSVKWVKQQLSLADLIPSIKKMAYDGALNYEIGYIVARMSPEQQLQVSDKLLHLTLDEAKEFFLETGVMPHE